MTTRREAARWLSNEWADAETAEKMLLALVADAPGEGKLPVCLKDALDALAAERERAEAAEREYGVAMTVLDEVRADRDSLAAQLKAITSELLNYELNGSDAAKQIRGMYADLEEASRQLAEAMRVIEAAAKMRREADCNEPYARLAAEAFDAALAPVGEATSERRVPCYACGFMQFPEHPCVTDERKATKEQP
jgi:DNA repair exonuclease SbcCD ATPase subunit